MKTKFACVFLALFFLTHGCQENKKKQSEISGNNNTEKAEVTSKYNCESSLEDFQKIDTMAGILYSLDPFEESAFDSIEILNGDIAYELEMLLSCPANRELDLSEKIRNLDYIQSDDGRIRKIGWDGNNGGTWYMQNCVYQYFLDEKRADAQFMEGTGGVDNFISLKKEPPVYLGFGMEKTCSTCSAEFAQLFYEQDDSLKIETVIGFDCRMGSILEFYFNPETKKIHFSVAIDDMNEELKEEFSTYPLTALEDFLEEMELQDLADYNVEEIIVDSLAWDGEKFIEI